MRLVALILAVVLVSGCEALLVAQGASVVVTNKGLDDHAVSLATGKDCSIVRREKGQTYCAEDEIEYENQLYCYKTLGRVSCYDRPDPYVSGQQYLGRNDHNFVPPEKK